jgi:hypothetical protein
MGLGDSITTYFASLVMSLLGPLLSQTGTPPADSSAHSLRAAAPIRALPQPPGWGYFVRLSRWLTTLKGASSMTRYPPLPPSRPFPSGRCVTTDPLRREFGLRLLLKAV